MPTKPRPAGESNAHVLASTPGPIALRAWTDRDIAAFLQCTSAELAVLRKTDPTFPAPRRLVFGERWVPEIIVGWFTGRETGQMSGPMAVAAPRKAGRHG